MAYANGSDVDLNGILAHIKSFGEDNGWVVDRFVQTDAGGDNDGADDRWLQLHSPQGGYHNLVSIIKNEDAPTRPFPKPILRIFGATGVNLDSPRFDSQPGSSLGPPGGRNNDSNSTLGTGQAVACTNGLRGLFTRYEIYGNAQYIHVMVEIIPGEFAHFGFGMANKQGDFAGGEYGYGTVWYYAQDITTISGGAYNLNNAAFMGSQNNFNAPNNSTGYFKVDVDGRTADWAHPREAVSPLLSCVQSNWRYSTGSRNPLSILRIRANEINGMAPLDPLLLAYQSRDQGCYIGQQVPDVRMVAMDYISPGESIMYGNDEYVCYPVKRKTGQADRPIGEVNSYIFGIAYKKVA